MSTIIVLVTNAYTTIIYAIVIKLIQKRIIKLLHNSNISVNVNTEFNNLTLISLLLIAIRIVNIHM